MNTERAVDGRIDERPEHEMKTRITDERIDGTNRNSGIRTKIPLRACGF
jgi:hypothetical protein